MKKYKKPSRINGIGGNYGTKTIWGMGYKFEVEH